MKKLTIPCDFGGKKVPFPIYVGEPEPSKHPLQHQAHWISSERGGNVPQEVMESFDKLHKIAKENNVPFEDLCVYALGQANNQNAPQEGGGQPADGGGGQPIGNINPAGAANG